MTTQIDWEEYNAAFIFSMCILEVHSHYLHYQIASILNHVFDHYHLTAEREEAIWNKIRMIEPWWLRDFGEYAPSHPIIRDIIRLLERRQPQHALAVPTDDEVLNGRGALYLILDELLGIPDGDPAGFGWRTE